MHIMTGFETSMIFYSLGYSSNEAYKKKSIGSLKYRIIALVTVNFSILGIVF